MAKVRIKSETTKSFPHFFADISRTGMVVKYTNDVLNSK